MGAFNFDNITTNGIDDAISTVLIPQDTTTFTTDTNLIPFDEPSLNVVTNNLVSPMTDSAFYPTPTLSSSSIPNHIYDIPEDRLYIDDAEPIVLPFVENSSIPFLT